MSAFRPGLLTHIHGERTIYTRLNDGCRGIPVARVEDDFSKNSQDYARLFAAAPELLQALKIALTVFEHLAETSFGIRLTRILRDRDQIRAAIAKAEGRE